MRKLFGIPVVFLALGVNPVGALAVAAVLTMLKVLGPVFLVVHLPTVVHHLADPVLLRIPVHCGRVLLRDEAGRARSGAGGGD